VAASVSQRKKRLRLNTPDGGHAKLSETFFWKKHLACVTHNKVFQNNHSHNPKRRFAFFAFIRG
jgi:hypothetical protein